MVDRLIFLLYSFFLLSKMKNRKFDYQGTSEIYTLLKIPLKSRLLFFVYVNFGKKKLYLVSLKDANYELLMAAIGSPSTYT